MRSLEQAPPSGHGRQGMLLCVALVVAGGWLGLGPGAAMLLAANPDLETVGGHYLFREYDQALQILDRLLAEDPAGSVPAVEVLVEAHVWRAKCLAQKGELQAALDAFCRVRELAPDWRPNPALFKQNELELFQRALAECVAVPAAPVEGDTRTDVFAPTVTETPAAAPPQVLKTRGQAVVRSLVPGRGQAYKGQRTKGTIIQVASALTAGLAVAGHLSSESAGADYDEARGQYDSAVSQADLDAAFARLQTEWDSVQKAEKLRDLGLYTFIGVYLYNLVDAALGFPLEESQLQMNAGSTRDGQVRLAFTLGARARRDDTRW